MAWAFENSKSTSGDLPLMARAHLLILLKQFCQLEMKHSNYEDMRVILIQTTPRLQAMEVDKGDQRNEIEEE